MARISRSLAALGLFLSASGAALAQDAPQRIVAIGGSVTEIVYALGQEDRLIARDTTSIFPEAALALPDVGYIRALSPEGVLSVDPDLILTLEGAGPPEAVEVLSRASVPMVSVPEGYDAEGVEAKIVAVGAALGQEEEARALADRIGAEIEAAQAAADEGEPPAVLFIISAEGGRLMASGTGTAADGMIRLAGGRNVIGAFPGYKQLTDEAVIDAAPDVVVMMDRGEGHDAASDAVLSHPAIAATPAGQDRRLVRMDGAYLLGFGPRTGSAVRDLAAELHGE
jgi:iron complex transport system substrate-binding protein